MLDGIEGVLNLAAASGEDLAQTSDIVTDALTAMGYSAGDAGRLADVMAAASSNANTNVGMMGQTFQYAAPIVGALKYSMEDTALAIGLMANAGIKADKAGTSLRSMLTRLSAPPKDCEQAMKDLGISIKNADGTMKPLNQVIQDLRSSFSRLSESEKTQYAKSIAGQEAMSGLLAIVNAAPSDYDKLTKAVENSNGAAKKMADTMQDNTEGGMTLLKSNIEGVQIAIYEKFEPALREGIKVLNGLTDAVKFVVDHSDEFTTAIGIMAAGVGGYVAYTTAINIMKNGWESLAAAQKLAAAAQGLLNAAMNISPIGLIVGAIAALVAGFVILWNNSEDFRNFWIGLWKAIEKATAPVIEAIVGWFSSAWETIKSVWGSVSKFFEELFASIGKSVEPIIDSMSNAFEQAWELIKVVWDLVQPYFQTVWESIKAVFSVVSTVIGGFFSVAWEVIKAVWDTVTGYFKAVWDSIAKIFSVVKSVLTGHWRDAWEGIKGIVNTWVQFFQGIWKSIKNVFSSVRSWFSSTFSSAWEAVKNVFSNWGKFFGNLWNIIKDKFSSIGTSIANAISGAVKSGINGVISIIENTINSAVNLINGAIGLINKIPGVNIGKLGRLNLPRLAKGGVLENGARTVIAGENGAEAIVPLENNTQWIKRVANELKSDMIRDIASNRNNIEQNNMKLGYNSVVEAFKTALSEVKIEMDDENMGKFVEKTVANAIYT